MNTEAIQSIQRSFVRERSWEPFHTPKNLSMALAGEAAELLEIFQWLTAEESKKIMRSSKRAEAVRDELADIFFYLFRLADLLDVDLEAAFYKKMKKNAKKYPVHLSRGKARKYKELKERRHS